MINAVKQVGELVEEKDFLKALVKDKGKFKYIVRINLNTTSKRIEFKLEEADDEKLNRYLWIGNVSGNSKKIYTTSDTLNNILVNSIYDIVKYIEDDLKKKPEEFSALKKFLSDESLTVFYKSYNYKNKKKLNETVHYLDWGKIDRFQEKLEEYNALQVFLLIW